jgi:hypothetical protein
VRAALAELACPSLAVSGGRPHGLAGDFDVVVGDEAALAPLAAAIERNPLASLALVQLLRGGAARSLHEGLVAESWVYATLQAGPEFRAWLAVRARPAPAPEPPGPAVRIDRVGDRLELTLDRPERRNAFSARMRDALCEALLVALADTSVAEIVLRGEGRAFCSGGDLDEFGTLPDPATAHAIRSTRNPARLLAACAGRVRSEIHGACVGAGIELPAFTRRVVAARDTFVQLPELSMGLVPGAGGSVSLPRRIGRQRTAWLALSGARIDAETAHGWGLVDELVG